VKQAVTSWIRTIDNYLFCTLVLCWDKFLKSYGHYKAATHLTCKPIHLRIRLSAAQNLLIYFISPMSFGKIQHQLHPQNPLSNYKAVPQGQQHNFCNCYIWSVHTVSYRKFCCRCQEIAECVGAEWQVRRWHHADWWTTEERIDQPCETLAERSSTVCHRRCVQ